MPEHSSSTHTANHHLIAQSESHFFPPSRPTQKDREDVTPQNARFSGLAMQLNGF